MSRLAQWFLALGMGFFFAAVSGCSSAPAEQQAADARANAPIELGMETIDLQAGADTSVRVEKGIIRALEVEPTESGVTPTCDNPYVLNVKAAKDAKPGQYKITAKGTSGEATVVVNVKAGVAKKR